MKILVIGSGAREHALCYAISKSPKTSTLYAIPGNYGISQIAQCVHLDISNFQSILQFCNKKSSNNYMDKEIK